MNSVACTALGVMGLVSVALMAPAAKAQVSVDIGVEPACVYGYYDYAPYPCAPYGYYGPEWFIGGAFIGNGPWFHGPRGFRGHVDNRFDARRGFNGRLPERGEPAERSHQPGQIPHFRGNEVHEPHGSGGHAGHGRE